MIRNSIILWSIALILMLMVFMSIFSSFADNSTILTETLSQMPKELLIAFGLNSVDMSAVLGFYSFIFLFCHINYRNL